MLDLTPDGTDAGAGDEIQALKSGVLEIADLFVVNKADHPGTALYVKTLESALHYGNRQTVVIETVATESKGIDRLMSAEFKNRFKLPVKKKKLKLRKSIHLILAEKMKGIEKPGLLEKIRQEVLSGHFNVYAFVEDYLSGGIRAQSSRFCFHQRYPSIPPIANGVNARYIIPLKSLTGRSLHLLHRACKLSIGHNFSREKLSTTTTHKVEAKFSCIKPDLLQNTNKSSTLKA